jgi:hypothetical protein
MMALKIPITPNPRRKLTTNNPNNLITLVILVTLTTLITLISLNNPKKYLVFYFKLSIMRGIS